MFKILMQSRLDSFDQLYQNDYNMHSVNPRKVRLVPKFSRLIALHFSELSLETCLGYSKISCKVVDSISIFGSEFPYLYIYDHIHASMLNPS